MPPAYKKMTKARASKGKDGPVDMRRPKGLSDKAWGKVKVKLELEQKRRDRNAKQRARYAAKKKQEGKTRNNPIKL